MLGRGPHWRVVSAIDQAYRSYDHHRRFFFLLCLVVNHYRRLEPNYLRGASVIIILAVEKSSRLNSHTYGRSFRSVLGLKTLKEMCFHYSVIKARQGVDSHGIYVTAWSTHLCCNSIPV